MRLLRHLGLAGAIVVSAYSTGSQALTIELRDQGGVAQGTSAFNGFRAAADFWESVFDDDATIVLEVGFSPMDGNVLGGASPFGGVVSRDAWRNAMIADATTALDRSVTANLPNLINPEVVLTRSQLKALGIYDGNPLDVDGWISFNSNAAFDFDTRDGFQAVASDFVAVAIHEIGHILGFVSGVGPDSTNESRSVGIDMFRHKNGTWDQSWGGNPYFSIDGGATEFMGNAGFSAGPDGFQTSHWREGRRIHDGVNCTQLLEPQVGIHDPTGGLCQMGIVTAQDIAIFDAMGFDVNFDILSNLGYTRNTAQIMEDFLPTAAIPESSTWAMMIAGFGALGLAMRRRRTSVAYA